jgi:4-hydroxyphenylacetate 3-monooxygenase
VLAPPDAGGARVPWAFTVPTTTDHLRGMGRCYAATTFPTAGNITHTPAYGHLIALGVHDAVLQRRAARSRARRRAYRALIARTGRFVTFCAGAATIGRACARIRPSGLRSASCARAMPASC